MINKEDKRNMRRFEPEEGLYEVRWEVFPYSSEQIRKKYQGIVEMALTNRFPRHGRTPTDYRKFTLHSLRSTYITHQLLNGVRICLIADNISNSESDIERTYYRLNNLLNIDELGMHKKVFNTEDELRVDGQ